MATPIGSSLGGLAGLDSTSLSAAATTAITPMGRLIRKIGRQSRLKRLASIISPPISGPAMVAMPITPPKIPSATARRCGGKATAMIEKIWGYISDAIRPWKTRAATSWVPSWASPQIADATVKPMTPAMNIRLRPRMSPSRPPVIRTTP